MSQEKEHPGEGGAGERLNFFENGGRLLHFDVESGPSDAPKSFPLFSMPRGKVGFEYANKIMDRFNGWDKTRQEVATLKEKLDRYEKALRKIAKPALGGKQQQYWAQEALSLSSDLSGGEGEGGHDEKN